MIAHAGPGLTLLAPPYSTAMIAAPLRALTLLSLSLLGVFVSEGQADLEFVDYDPTRLKAKLVKLTPIRGKQDPGCHALLEFDGGHGFQGDIEPLVFRISPKPKDLEPIQVRRFEGTLYGRVGGRPSEIPVLLPWTIKQAKGARVEVLDASAWTGEGAPEECPVEVGTIKNSVEFNESRDRSLPRAVVTLRNSAEHDVDVVLLADYLEPENAESLVQARVPAGETLDLVIDLFETGAGPFLGAKIKRVTTVDWSMIVDHGEERGRALLQEALNRCYTVPKESLPTGSAFTLEFRSATHHYVRKGMVRIEQDGEVRIEVEGELSGAARKSTQHTMEEALWCITRKPLPEGTRVQLMRAGPRPIVRVDRNFLGFGNSGAQSLVLEEGGIAGISSDELCAEYSAWGKNPWINHIADEWRLRRRSSSVYSGLPDEFNTVDTGWLGSGSEWMPSRVVWTNSDWAGVGSREVLSFDLWTSNPAPIADREPPTGELAEKLAAAWDSFYRYPESEVRITGAYRARNPGNDGIWGGERDLKGDFELAAFRGSFWRDAKVDFSGKARSKHQDAVLENALLDRFLMWSGRDLCRTLPFAEAFAGAQLKLDGNWISVTGATVQAVRIVEGRVAAIRDSRGSETSYKWSEVGGFLVPIQSSRGIERLVMKWKRLSDGWLWPKHVEFNDVFTREDYPWGPESLEFSKVKVELLNDE